mgnify:CR=1 FL=1
MLDKYEAFYKESRVLDCSIFSAFNRQTAQGVLIKKTGVNNLTWNEILCHKQLQLSGRIKLIPKLSEILRHKGNFMFVYEKPYGNSLAINRAIEKQEF